MSIAEMIPARVVLTIMGFCGAICLYSMRVNLNVAMIAMVGKPSTPSNYNTSTDACIELITIHNNSAEGGEITTTTGEFDWDTYTQGQVVGSFFYGYLFTQLPGGILAERYGAKWIYGMGIFITSVLTLLTPTAARWSVWALLAVRVGEGLAGGVAFPVMNVLIGRWVPRIERSRVATSMNMGVLVGTVATNSLTGILCDSPHFGWPSVFYICGTLGCIWFLFWIFLIYETPDLHPRISKRELMYIKKGQDKVTKNAVKIPWKDIWTSLPVWGVIVAHFGQNWSFYILLTMMPTYLSNIMHFELSNNGILSGFPYLMMLVFAVPASIVADHLRAGNYLRITTIRKNFTSIAALGPAICLLVIAFAGCRPSLIIALFSIALGVNGLIYSGLLVNHVDMSPQFAGTLMGLSNAVGTMPGFLAPSFVGVILSSGQTLENWAIVFVTTSALLLVSVTFYDLFSSAELQPWNDTSKYESEKRKESENGPCSSHL